MLLRDFFGAGGGEGSDRALKGSLCLMSGKDLQTQGNYEAAKPQPVVRRERSKFAGGRNLLIPKFCK